MRSEPDGPGSDPSLEAPVDPRVGVQRRIGAWGSGVGVFAAVGVGVGGGSGQAGMAVLLLVLALTATLIAVYGVLMSLIDEFRDRPISRRRVGWSLGAFFLAAALMAMVAGVGG